MSPTMQCSRIQSGAAKVVARASTMHILAAWSVSGRNEPAKRVVPPWQVMTCMRPKTYFLRPDVALPMGFAVLRELWAQKVAKRPDAYKML